jgi:hypothetical protein
MIEILSEPINAFVHTTVEMSEGEEGFLLGHLWSWLWAFSVFAIPALVIPSLYFHYKKDVASVTKTWKKSWLMYKSLFCALHECSHLGNQCLITSLGRWAGLRL